MKKILILPLFLLASCSHKPSNFGKSEWGKINYEKNYSCPSKEEINELIKKYQNNCL